MVTATLSDGVTTITFDGFPVVANVQETVNFTTIAFPENEGTEVIYLGQTVDVYTITWKLKDDASYPSSGDSAADKKLALKNLLKSGGVNDYLFTLTFDSEDSIPGSPPQLEVYTGKVRKLSYRSEGGTNVSVIKGEFEFVRSD